MTHEEIMSQLRDVHLAPPPLWWPPAFGYYMVVLGVFVLAILVFLFFRMLRRGRVRKILLLELCAIEQNFNVASDTAALQAALSALLRRLAFTINKALPRNSDLDMVMPVLVRATVDKNRVASIIELLKEGRYQKHAKIDGTLLIGLTRETIKRCRI